MTSTHHFIWWQHQMKPGHVIITKIPARIAVSVNVLLGNMLCWMTLRADSMLALCCSTMTFLWKGKLPGGAWLSPEERLLFTSLWGDCSSAYADTQTDVLLSTELRSLNGLSGASLLKVLLTYADANADKEVVELAYTVWPAKLLPSITTDM